MKLVFAIRNWLWPIGVFHDASRGNLFERAAAYRHNWEARGCLLYFISNWMVVAVLTSGAGVWLANVNCLVLSCICWMLLACSISQFVVLSAVYLALTVWGP